MGRVKQHLKNVFFVQDWLELPGVHPLEAGHGAALLVCQGPRHAIGQRMEQVETERKKEQKKE